MTDIVIDNKKIELVLWDTAGQEGYERLRPLSYPDTNVIVMCYSIDNPDSLKNISDKWHPELRFYCPRAPVILVGILIDLKNSIIYYLPN